MKNDTLDQIWKSQSVSSHLLEPKIIIRKAQNQRRQQWITIGILSLTVVILILYAIRNGSNNWNSFSQGLSLMILSLTFRLSLEYLTIYRKKSHLIYLDNRAFQKYLKKYYLRRRQINYFITPICYGVYIYGFMQLLPYFKNEFSKGFYTYILISGIVSLLAISLIIINTMLKERKFLQELNHEKN